MVERQTENLKVESSILFVGIVLNYEKIYNKTNKHLLKIFICLIKNKSKINIINYNKYNFKLKKLNKLIPTSQFSIFFVNNKNINKFSKTLYFQFLNLWYLNHIFKINLKEKNVNALTILPKKLLNFILFKTIKKNYKQFNIKYFNEIAFLFIISVWLKNAKNICKYIKKKLNNIHFKKHRIYFLFFFRIFNKYIIPNKEILHLKGVDFRFKGKLGRGGNSRKKTMFYKKGYYSLSNKNLAMNYNKWDVWTKTGSVGCSLKLFF